MHSHVLLCSLLHTPAIVRCVQEGPVIVTVCQELQGGDCTQQVQHRRVKLVVIQESLDAVPLHLMTNDVLQEVLQSTHRLWQVKPEWSSAFRMSMSKMLQAADLRRITLL